MQQNLKKRLLKWEVFYIAYAWCTRQDSNLRPLAPQANALSS
jgi:hypothetical protein